MLITCKECELPVSDKAVSCPHCGFPLIGEYKPARRKTARRRRLPNGFGQITEIKGKNLRNPFRVMVTVSKDECGKPICRLLTPHAYFRTYNEAYEALVEYNKNPYDLDDCITMNELYDRWSQEYYETTSKSYTKVLKSAWAYCASIYDVPVTTFRQKHIRICMEHGERTIRGVVNKPSTNTKTNMKLVISLLLSYAQECDMIQQNCAKDYKLKIQKGESRETKTPHIPFTDEEMQILWANVGKIPYVNIILIQCYTGWRPQELGLIEMKDVDLNMWAFRGGIKSDAGRHRFVPIHPCIRDLVLEEYKRAESINSGHIFNFIDGNKTNKSYKLTYDRYFVVFNDVINTLKLNQAHRPHDPRKHFTTMAKFYKMDEYAVKYIVGHKIKDITEAVYTARQPEFLIEEIQKIKGKVE